jgi:hypothetical protein
LLTDARVAETFLVGVRNFFFGATAFLGQDNPNDLLPLIPFLGFPFPLAYFKSLEVVFYIIKPSYSWSSYFPFYIKWIIKSDLFTGVVSISSK